MSAARADECVDCGRFGFGVVCADGGIKSRCSGREWSARTFADGSDAGREDARLGLQRTEQGHGNLMVIERLRQSSLAFQLLQCSCHLGSGVDISEVAGQARRSCGELPLPNSIESENLLCERTIGLRQD